MRGICPNCEKYSDLQYISKSEQVTIRNERIEIPVGFYKCNECGDEFEDSKSKEDPLEKAYKEYRKRHGMMQPEDIRNLRQKYGLTQKELSKLLGWGEVTLTRYENGALQDKGHDTILQMIKDPQNLLKIVDQYGDYLSEGKKEKVIGYLRNELDRAHSFSLFITTHIGQYKPDIFSGFKRLDIEKLFQAITFFCVDGSLKTKLNKLLFYMDFKHFKDNASSITGVRYVHLPLGPVPDNYDFYFAILQADEKTIELKEELHGRYIGEVYYACKKPDLAIFSNGEIKTLIEVKDKFKNFNATDIKRFSHNERGYRETEDKEFISYIYADDIQI